jgi:hypothetical protein
MGGCDGGKQNRFPAHEFRAMTLKQYAGLSAKPPPPTRSMAALSPTAVKRER